MVKTSTLAPWIALLALSCADLRTLNANQCGNGIIEQGEDCDGVGVGDSKCSSACRLLCTADHACPGGWGCGADDICRQPTGQYEPFGATLALSADRLTLADFDGDGRSDVLATRGSTFSIAYLDPSGLQSKTTTVSFAEGARGDVPAAGDVDGDARADVAFRLRDGLGVLRGQADRTLTASAYSSSLDEPLEDSDVLLAADVDPRVDAPGDEVLAIRDDGLYVVHTAHKTGTPGRRLYAWPAGHGKLLGAPPSGFFDPTGITRGFAFAFEGDSAVTLFSPMVRANDPLSGAPTFQWNVDAKVAPVRTITLPAGAKVTQGVFVSSAYDNSQGQDIVISGEDDTGAPALFVSYAIVQGGGALIGYNSQPGTSTTTTPDDAASLFTRLDEAGLPAGPDLAVPPLAVADINFDDVFDIVTPKGVYISRCDIPPAYCFVPGQIRYRLAAKPDTAAGWSEVAAIASGVSNNRIIFPSLYLASAESGLTYLRGNLTGSYNNIAFDAFRVPTQSAMKHLALADFDGDGALDLAFSQTSSRDTSVASLHVSFGSALGIPTAPVDLGDIGAVSSITAARLVAPGAFERGSADLAIRTKAGAPAQSVLYRFGGSADRQMQSPIELTTPCDATSANVTPLGTPRAVAMGLFDAGAGRDVAVLYQRASGGYELWSVNPEETDTRAICARKIGPGALPDLGDREITMVPVDLDGDGRDEVLILPKGSDTLVHAKIGNDGAWAVDTLALGDAYRGIATADLGARKAGEKPALDVMLWSDEGVLVLWNDGTGKLSAAGAGRIDASKVACGGGAAGPPLGVAALNMDGDGEREIVVVTARATLVADFEDAAARKLGAAACAKGALAGGGEAVTTGDVDGNGVADLVIARPGGIQVFVGTPVVK